MKIIDASNRQTQAKFQSRRRVPTWIDETLSGGTSNILR